MSHSNHHARDTAILLPEDAVPIYSGNQALTEELNRTKELLARYKAKSKRQKVAYRSLQNAFNAASQSYSILYSQYLELARQDAIRDRPGSVRPATHTG